MMVCDEQSTSNSGHILKKKHGNICAESGDNGINLKKFRSDFTETGSDIDLDDRNSSSEADDESSGSEDTSSSGDEYIQRFNRRKPRAPHRGAMRSDPKFRGATVYLRTKIDGEDSRLEIKAYFSNTRRPSERNHFKLRRNSDSNSGSDTEESSGFRIAKPYFQAKYCTSCSTRKTPLWRDAEDGTPLCNACGIRYKKYRIRCSKCWHIPKKDVKTFPNCPVCSSPLRLSLSRKSIW